MVLLWEAVKEMEKKMMNTYGVSLVRRLPGPKPYIVIIEKSHLYLSSEIPVQSDIGTSITGANQFAAPNIGPIPSYDPDAYDPADDYGPIPDYDPADDFNPTDFKKPTLNDDPAHNHKLKML